MTAVRFVLYILLRADVLTYHVRAISTTDNYYFYVEEFLFNSFITVFLLISVL